MLAGIVSSKSIQAFALAFLLASCAGVPGDVIGIDGQAVSARDLEGVNKHRILVATTRKQSDDPAIMFSGGRGALSFAHVDVYVPPNHEPGKIERAGSMPPDPRKEFVALDPVKLPDGSAFVSTLNTELTKLPKGERDVLVFIHGFNTSFDSAIYRLAQFVNDSGYTGIPVLFTWPSAGRTRDYLYDLNSALASRDELLETFQLVGKSKLERGDILAHSMGNMLTVEALRQAALVGKFRRSQKPKLRYVVLASPDVDVYLFAKQVKSLPVDTYDFFTLISRDDKALRFSKFLAGGARVGGADTDSLKNLGITIVDLTDVKNANGTHSKFAGSPEIVRALGGVLGTGGSVDTSREPPAGVQVIRSVINIPSTLLGGVLPPAAPN